MSWFSNFNWRCFFGLHDWVERTIFDRENREQYIEQTCRNCSRVNILY
jgi:hypothetical protein